MFAKLMDQKRSQANRNPIPAITATVVFVGSLFLGAAHSSEKVSEMPMGSYGSMEMSKSMMDGMKAMQSMKPSGDADHDFATMMKMHHQSALDMAKVELKNGKDAKLRDMANAIIESQTKEIADFDEWLASHPKPMASSAMKPK